MKILLGRKDAKKLHKILIKNSSNKIPSYLEYKQYLKYEITSLWELRLFTLL